MAIVAPPPTQLASFTKKEDGGGAQRAVAERILNQAKRESRRELALTLQDFQRTCSRGPTIRSWSSWVARTTVRRACRISLLLIGAGNCRGASASKDNSGRPFSAKKSSIFLVFSEMMLESCRSLLECVPFVTAIFFFSGAIRASQSEEYFKLGGLERCEDRGGAGRAERDRRRMLRSPPDEKRRTLRTAGSKR